MKPMTARARKNWRRAIILVLITCVYVIAGKTGLMLATVNPSATAVWAPTGIAIAAYLLWGNEIWISIFIGAFLVNITTNGTIFSTIGIACGNTLEGLVASLLIRRFADWPHSFKRLRSVILFTFFAAGVGPMISASIGVLSLAVAGYTQWHTVAAVWSTWWVGDAVGAILVAPLILLFFRPSDQFPASVSKNWWELFLLYCFAFLSLSVVYGGELLGLRPHLPITYLCIPAVVWAAIRFGSRLTCILTFLICICGIVANHYGMGPFGALPATLSIPLLQSTSGVIAFIGLILSAVTAESRLSQAKVLMSETRFRQLIERSFDAICLIDDDGTILYASPAVQRLIGYAPETFVGTNRFSYVHPEDLPTLRNHMYRLLEHPGESRRSEFRFRNSNGSWVWLESLSTNLKHVPEIRAIVSNFRDITTRKMEEIAKSQFVSLASHQLRTPLTKIRWALNTLALSLTGKLEPKDQRILDGTERESKAMADIIDTLLMLTKLASGHVQPHHTTIEVASLLQNVTETFKVQCQTEHRTIRIEADANIRVHSDEALLKQILNNLVSNALKFSPQHSTVHLRAWQTDDEVGIEVHDSGMGIAVHEQVKIFSLFFRGQNATDANIAGMGLGLYVVQSLIRQLRGTVSFRSNVTSTVFSVVLPRYGQPQKFAVSERSREKEKNVW